MPENNIQNLNQGPQAPQAPAPTPAPQAPQPVAAQPAPGSADEALKSTTPPASALVDKDAPKDTIVDKAKDFIHNKGLVLGVVLVVLAVVVGFSVLFGFNANDQYQGMIQKIEQDTADINSN